MLHAVRPKGLTTAACFLQYIEGIKSVASWYCLKNDVCHTPSTASRNVVVGTAAVRAAHTSHLPVSTLRTTELQSTDLHSATIFAHQQPHLQQRVNDTMRCTIHCC